MLMPGIPATSWRSLQRAKRAGIEVRVRQLAAHWIAVVDGDVAHINDAPKLVQAAFDRRKAAT